MRESVLFLSVELGYKLEIKTKQKQKQNKIKGGFYHMHSNYPWHTKFKEVSIFLMAAGPGGSSGDAKSIGKINSLGAMDFTRKVRVATEGSMRK